MDFDGIKERGHRDVLAILQSVLPGGKLRGREYECGDLNGQPGDSLKYNIDRHTWSDFATGDSGYDIISLVAAAKRLDQGAAARWVGEFAGAPMDDEAKPAAKPKASDVKCILPATEELPPERLRHPQNGAPSAIYDYRDEHGRLLNYVLRWDLSNGQKDIRPYTQTAEGWKWVQIPRNRPLWGLQAAAARPAATILLVEGEKAAIAAQRLLQNVVVMTWSGGSNAVKKADFKPLHGRKVCLWPDNDDAGRKAMNDIAVMLLAKCPTIKLIKPPADLPEKWDAADAVAEGFFEQRDPYAWIKENSGDWQPERKPSPQDAPTSEASTLEEVRDARHFDPLGYEEDTYYFYSHYKKQYCRFKPATFKSDVNLLELAPQNYWRDRYTNGKGGIDFLAVAQALMAQCWKLGVFSPESERVRGIGAWWDDGRIVVHLGDKMLVDGKAYGVGGIDTDYVYHQMKRVPFPAKCGEPTKEELDNFIKLTASFNWENNLSAYLLRGWCAISPVCGALRWRPHIWITGKRGSGKTWILNKVVREMTQFIGIHLESVMTSESYVRNKIGINAIPVCFDELEGETKANAEKIQNILMLARIASSDSTALVGKATQTGGTREYIVKSCFAFASIAENIKSEADESRITLLNLTASEGGDAENAKFTEMERMAEGIRGDFSSKVFKRTIRLLPVIRKNAEVFAQAGSTLFKSRRAGDQLGHLLAGAYSLVSENVVDLATAKEWIDSRNFMTLVPVSIDNAASPCLEYLLQRIITVKSPSGAMYERTIGELCILAARKHTTRSGDLDLTCDAAHDALRRRGILVEPDCVMVANQNPELEAMFKETMWLGSWARYLQQIPSADNNEGRTVYFASGCKQKATRLRLLLEGE